MGNGGRRVASSENFLDQRAGGRQADGKVKVLFIGGYGRSGSILLARMLGQIPGFVSVGELRYIWRGMFLGDRLCGCGTPLQQCPFWVRVGQEAFGGWDTLDLEEALILERSVDRDQYIPLLLAPEAWPAYRARWSRYVELLGRLYNGIQKVAGPWVVVDSTKDSSYAFLLRQVPGLDLRVAHLVRDSRGVAFSWTKRVVRPGIQNEVAYMPIHSPVRTSMRWLACNMSFHLLGSLGIPSLFIRYEDLVGSTRFEMERILVHAGEEIGRDSLTFLGTREVELKPDHTVGGNPMRFHQGNLQLRTDEQWRVKMGQGQRRLVSLLTWPRLLRYGYLTRRERSNGNQ